MRTPAGLLDGNFEYFVSNNDVFGILNGSVIGFDEVPKHIEKIFFDEFLNDVDFIKKNGNIVTRSLFKYWVKINYGRLDHVPDLEIETGKTNNENIEKQFKLSNREVEVMKEISTGDPDKWIKDRMHISLMTVRQHVKHISRKLNLNGKTAITRFAFEHSII